MVTDSRDTRRPRTIKGDSQTQNPRGFGGLDEYYALQRAGVSAFDSTPGAPGANALANQVRDSGMSIDRSGSLQPMGYSQFRQRLQESRNQPAATMRDVQALVHPSTGGVDTSLSDAVAALGRGESPASQALPSGPTPSDNAQRLRERANGLGLLRSTQQAGTVSPSPVQPGGQILTSRYGTGSSTLVPTAGRQEGMINGRPASEALQGLANSQGRTGLSRPGDKYQPQPAMASNDADRLRRRISPGRFRI